MTQFHLQVIRHLVGELHAVHGDVHYWSDVRNSIRRSQVW